MGNVTANENGNYGLNIERNVGTGAISVTRGTFDHNTFGGVRIYTTPGRCDPDRCDRQLQ